MMGRVRLKHERDTGNDGKAKIRPLSAFPSGNVRSDSTVDQSGPSSVILMISLYALHRF